MYSVSEIMPSPFVSIIFKVLSVAKAEEAAPIATAVSSAETSLFMLPPCAL
jgi:hypothetical protein